METTGSLSKTDVTIQVLYNMFHYLHRHILGIMY